MTARIVLVLSSCILLCLCSCKQDHVLSPPGQNDSTDHSNDTTHHSQLVINSFSPAAGQVGEQVHITGFHFGNDPDAATVWFGIQQAAIVSINDSSLDVIVPKAAITSRITVVIGQDTGISQSAFIVRLSPFAYNRGIVEFSNIQTLQRYQVFDFDPYHQNPTDTLEADSISVLSFVDSTFGCAPDTLARESGDTIRVGCLTYVIGINRDREHKEIWADVDTLHRKFRTVAILREYQKEHVTRTNDVLDSLYYRDLRNLEVYLHDVPYEEKADGSLVCTLPRSAFESQLTVERFITAYVLWKEVNRYIQPDEARYLFLMNFLPSQGYIRITFRR